MKILLFITSLFYSVGLFAQFEHYDQSQLYIELGIGTVNEFELDSGKRINTHRWEFNEKAFLISDKLLETKDDSTFGLKSYIYDQDNLAKELNIGIWNISSNTYDTSTTTYEYSENRIKESIRTNTRNSDTIISTYEFSKDSLICKITYDKYGLKRFSDSIFYYKTGLKHIVKKQIFETDYTSDTTYLAHETVQYYDTLGQLSVELDKVLTDNNLLVIQTKTYDYENRRLMKIIELYLGNYEFWGEKMSRKTMNFQYNKSGLISRKEYYFDDIHPFLVYEYEYE